MAERQGGFRGAIKSAGGVFLPRAVERKRQAELQAEIRQHQGEHVKGFIDRLIRRREAEKKGELVFGTRHAHPHHNGCKRPKQRPINRAANKRARVARRKNRAHS